MTLDEQIAFCEEKSKNIKLKAEPQVFIDIKACLEELKEIRGCISEIGKFIGREKATAYEQGYSEGTKSAKGQRWISVADRLPDDDTTVLCLVGNRYMTVEPFYALGDYRGGAWYIGETKVKEIPLFDDIFSIFYWTPLPEKPQEVKQ